MRILALLNNVTDIDTWNKGFALIQYQARSINLSIEFTVKQTDRKFTSVAFKNETNSNGYEIDPAQLADEENKYGDYDVTWLTFDALKIINAPTNPADNGEYIQLPIQWYGKYPEVMAQYFWHEMSHYFAWKTHTYDWTHLLQHRDWNPTLYDQWGNKQPTDFYLHLIQGLNVPTSPTATLTRHNGGNETFGDFVASNGVATLKCYSLELPWLNNQPNISCVPTGTYTCKFTTSAKFPQGSYELQNVPGRTGIRIHAGNFATGKKIDIDGCILIGSRYDDLDNNGEEDIINSQATVASLESLFQKKDFILEIK